MSITYGLIKEEYRFEEYTRVSYGIAAYANTEINETATIVASVHDVTSNKQALEELVLLCNSMALSLVHLNCVIDDFLASY